MLKLLFGVKLLLHHFAVSCHFRCKKNAGWFGESNEEFRIQSWIHRRFAENEWCKIYISRCPRGILEKLFRECKLYWWDFSSRAFFIRCKGQKLGTCFGQAIRLVCIPKRHLRVRIASFKKNEQEIYKLEINKFTLYRVTNSSWTFFQLVCLMSEPV